MLDLNNIPTVDSDFLAVLAEQGINPTYSYNGVISGKNNCGVNFSKLGIETRYDKNQINEKTGNKINPDKELSIFVMVHGGSPIDTEEKKVYNNKEKIDDSYSISVKNLICDKYILAQRGKKYYFIITID